MRTMQRIEIPGYELIEELPQGGMSTVYKARQLSLDRIVALKTLPPQMAADSADIEQFLFEAKGAAKLKHSGIVQVYDFGEASGTYYLVMEFISGYSVSEWLREEKVLNKKDALVIAESVAEALDYAWETARIIHCDIKPDNIMVDGDGTIKVADLGLAKTVGILGTVDGPRADMIMGTPNYISPEQASGEKDLDCRTDIYSLGAMLYYVVTGRMVFEEFPETEVIDRQISDQITDPRDVNPAVSLECACLIETLMAKSKHHRPADWKAVIQDVARVKAGHLPITPLPPAGASTVMRSPARIRYLQRRRAGKRRAWPRVVTAATAVLAVVFCFGLARAGCFRRRGGRFAPAHATTAGAAGNARVQKARHAYDSAEAWATEHPGDYDQTIARFELVVVEAADTRFAAMARQAVRRLNATRSEEIGDNLRRLRQEAEQLGGADTLEAAARLCETYEGRYATETREQRRAMADEFRTLGRERAAARQAEAAQRKEARNTVIERAAERLVDMDVEGAQALVLDARIDPEMAPYGNDWVELLRLLEVAGGLEARIIHSFHAARGRKLVVHLAEGAEEVYVRAVSGNTVHAEKLVRVSAGYLRRNITFGVLDLAMKEKRARVGKDETGETALLQGLLSVEAKAYPSAREYFSRTSPVFAQPLVAALDRKRITAGEATARRALARLMNLMDMQVGEYDKDYWLAVVAEAGPSVEQIATLKGHVQTYRDRYGNTQFGREAEPVLAALAHMRPSAGEPRPLDIMSPTQVLLFKRAVLALSPDEQLPEVERKLRQQNPGMSAEPVVFARGPDGVVTQVKIVDRALRDIGPLAVLSTLRDVACSESDTLERVWGTERRALSDLFPLRGLQLNALRCEGSRVADLGPLAGMPLEKLFLARTEVADLAVLFGMPLRILRVSYTKVKDLTPLRGMQLEHLIVARTPVAGLAPLAGMPLKYLDVSHTLVDDLTPLRGMPLESLLLENTYVDDLAPLADMPLRKLNIRDTPVLDLSPLEGSPIEELWLDQPSEHRPLLNSLRRLNRVNGKHYRRR